LKLAALRPDLIIPDVNLPDINGFDECRRLNANKRTAGIPVVFLSAEEHSTWGWAQRLDWYSSSAS
jgi:DNA-binding response OmpR family regulator